MAQTNVKRRVPAMPTHEGAKAMREKPIAALERVLNAHMLWEDGFYLDGVSNADALALAVDKAVHHNAFEAGKAILRARGEYNIRHASLYAAVLYAKANGPDARDLILNVISRADELGEVLAMAGSRKAPHAVMKGVRDAFAKFDEYQFGKYKGEGKAVTLRDAVFLTHPDPSKLPLVQKIVDETLAVPDTWETGLSAGEDKKTVFERLLRSNKLGAMALLRNLRNMEQAGVSPTAISNALRTANWSKVMPFRFLSAAIASPKHAQWLDAAFKQAVMASDVLQGSTAVLVDTSGSMTSPLSQKSTVQLVQAGAVLGAAINGHHVDLYEWAETTRMVPNWQSLSSALSIRCGAVGHGTRAGQAIEYANRKGVYDRIIVITDMQFADTQVPGLQVGQRGYTINLSPYGNPGLMHGNWTHLTGFSAATLKYIAGVEA